MGSVSVNPPKTPVTKGSSGIAPATIPNVCKMPGPPAPFVPVPLPNIGKSGKSIQGYSQDVTIEGNAVAIKGATFESMGDIASKGTGGGLVSANCEGITKFVGPGSMDVKIEGQNVQLLSDPMLNNCGPGGSPPNSATLVGLIQGPGLMALAGDEPCPICEKTHDQEDTPDNNRQVKESAATKQAAGDLQAIAKDISETGSKTAAKGLNMLGAIECVSGQVFVAVSGSQPKAMVDKMKEKSWHHHANPGSTSPTEEPVDRFSKKITEGRREAFKKVWEELEDKAGKQRETRNRGEKVTEKICLPPGTCAAQQAMVLALDHGNRPKALTERYAKGGAGVLMFYRTDAADKVGRPGWFGGDGGPAHMANLDAEGVPQEERQHMGADKSVPPCGTCEVILTALMCNQRDKTCEEKKPKVCKCSPKK